VDLLTTSITTYSYYLHLQLLVLLSRYFKLN